MTANEIDHARTLLNRIPALRRSCDLDLLVFFAKHPRTLIASEQLARLLGYRLNEIDQSLDVLLAAGLLTRTQTPICAARMYVFETGGTNGGSLPAVVELASTREGRLALRRALTHRPEARTIRRRKPEDDATAPAGAWPFPARCKPETDEQRKRKQ